jgi:hypothetical protein
VILALLRVPELLARVNLPTAIAAALLVLAVILATKVGKVLLVAAIVGAFAGGASLGQGNSAAAASTHVAVGFGVAAVTLFLVKLTKYLAAWLLITAAGVGALLVYGFRP